MADSTTKQAQDLLRAQALCGSPAALDLLLAFREVETTQKLTALFMATVESHVSRSEDAARRFLRVVGP